MQTKDKMILIVDEAGFSRVCSAILEKEGYGTNAVTDVRLVDSKINNNELGLVITSYPYGEVLFGKLMKKKIPTIILSDQLNSKLMTTLDLFDKSLSHCLIKPIDFTKFRALVNQVMHRIGGNDGQAA